MQIEKKIRCPYCAEKISVFIDLGVPEETLESPYSDEPDADEIDVEPQMAARFSRLAGLNKPRSTEEAESATDGDLEHHSYVEDCSVCCRPIAFAVVSQSGRLKKVEVNRS